MKIINCIMVEKTEIEIKIPNIKFRKVVDNKVTNPWMLSAVLSKRQYKVPIIENCPVVLFQGKIWIICIENTYLYENLKSYGITKTESVKTDNCFNLKDVFGDD